MKRLLLLLFICLCLSAPAVTPLRAIECEFQNPLIQFGQDPSVVYHDGFYYLVQSNAGQLTIAKSETITGMGSAEPVPVYSPPPGEQYSYDMWAPELQYIDGAWYIYIAATSAPGANATHRMFVLQADSDDPQGTWTMQGKVADSTDKWAIDGVVFEYDDQLYMVWSGWETDQGDFPQNLYIAPMSDPLTISGERVLLSEPDQPWERTVAALQEGPQPFIYEDQVTIVYSADASWMPAYKLGMLVFDGDDPLDAEAWRKVGPIFEQDSEEGIYGPGHNSSPVVSPDGGEFWHFYHAKMLDASGWGDRAILAAPFTWDADGVPQFDEPDFNVETPSGEPCGVILTADDSEYVLEAEQTFAGDFLDTGMSYVDTTVNFSVETWVKLTDVPADVTYAIVSQEGGLTSNFALEYTQGKLAFTLYNERGNEWMSAFSTFAPEADRWYHLVGVREVSDGSLTLYVDGVLQSTEVFESSWASRGSTVIGAGKSKAQRVNLLQGSVRGVRLYTGALQAEDIPALME
jgi:GH43 family beta-xylosidase